MSTLKERLFYLIDKKGVTPYKISKEINIPQSTFTRIKNDTSDKITLQNDTAVKLSNYFEVSKEWLLAGEGEMLKEKLSKIESNAEFLDMSSVQTMRVPVVPVRAHAGTLNGYGDPEYMDSLETMDVMVDRTYKGNYRIFIVSGDSMNDGTFDSLLDGDRVLCRSVHFDYWKHKLHTKTWKYWVFVTRTEGVVIKKIKEQNTETGEVILESLNPMFKDIHIHMNDVVEIYNVIKIVERSI